MVYLDYITAKRKYNGAQDALCEILDEQEVLFSRTQPTSTKYDRERVEGGDGANSFDEYVIAKERSQIDKRLEEAKKILNERKAFLDQRERELRASRFLIDRIYCMRFLDKMRVNRIASMIGYAESHVYRFLKKIEDSAKDERK